MFLNCVLNWDTFARIWTTKYLSKVRHTWAEFSQFTICVRIPSDIEERSQDNNNWSCCSQSRNSGLTLSISSSLSVRNLNGEGFVPNTKFCNLCPRIAARTCFRQSKKLLLSNRTETKWLKETRMNLEADDEAPPMVEIEKLSIAGISKLGYHIRI